MKPKTLSQEQAMLKELEEMFKCNCVLCQENGHKFTTTFDTVKDFFETQLQKAKDATWKEMKDELLSYLAEGRELEVAALEASKLVPDKHYHKGKIHLIDDIIENIS